MIHLTAAELLTLFPQENDSCNDFEFSGVKIDSREDCQGSLFVAIKGEFFDGHDYVQAAMVKGAKAVIVESLQDVSGVQLVVKDCRQALAKLATYWRRKVNPQVTAITGSNGKTTVKEMLARILSTQKPTLKTAGNLNNDLGVPLTLLNLKPSDKFAVVEMGANHVGEIRQLVTLAEPDVVYVNNAQSAHVEGFGSLQSIIKAKGEIYQYCKNSAYAVFNDDEDAADFWKSIASTQRHLLFSSRHTSDITGSYDLSPQGVDVSVHFKGQLASCHLQVQGLHNAQNALAAITLALANGCELQDCVSALSGFNGVQGRQQQMKGVHDCLILDDSYNANPGSLSAAVDVLCQMPGDHWLALGDMAELGKDAIIMHQKAVREARDAGIQKFFALGELSCQAASVFGDEGYCFSTHEAMADYLSTHLHDKVNLLVKGSRSTRMEIVVRALTPNDALNPQAGERHAV